MVPQRKLEVIDPKGNPQTINVRIPKGVRDGERVRVKGKGAPGSGGRQGDLYLYIHLLPHSIFKRQGDNILLSLPVCAMGGHAWCKC